MATVVATATPSSAQTQCDKPLSSAASFGILTVGPTGNLTIRDVIITNGDAPDFGGGIANYGKLTVRGSIVRNNHANYSGGIGGFSGTTTQIEGTSITGEHGQRQRWWRRQ